MTTPTAATVNARENARQSTGEFGYQQKSTDESVALAAGVSAREAAVEAMARYIGEGVRPEVEARFDRLSTVEGEALLAAYLTSGNKATDDGSYQSDFDNLATLGHRDPETMCSQAKRVFGHDALREIDRRGITPERLEVLADIRPNHYHSTTWERQAYDTGDLDVLRTAVGKTPLEQYAAVAASLGTDKAERLNACLAAGLGTKHLIEAEDCSPGDLAAMHSALSPSKKNLTADLVRAGHTPETVKTYGVNMAADIDAADLKASRLKPSELKAMYSGSRHKDVAVLEALHDTGYRKSSDLRDMAAAIGTDHHDALMEARKIAEPADVRAYLPVVARRDKPHLDTEELNAIRDLSDLGHKTPASIPPIGLHSASQWASGSLKELPVMASILKAGVEPRTAAAMSRAGIPAERIAEFKDAPDYWEAGKAFRDGYDKEQTHRVERGWVRSKAPWAFTKDDYLAVD